MEKKINIIAKGQNWKQNSAKVLNIRDIAHPVDKALIKILEAAHAKELLNAPLEQLVSAKFGPTLATGIPLDEQNFPELYALMQQSCRMLGIKMPYTVVSNEISGINAFATGTDNRPFVVISNITPHCLKPKELQFILAHECGHIAMEHMVYHTAGTLASVMGGFIPVIGPILTQAVVFPLNCWNRCSEITSDRIGLICCGDLHTAQMALLKIVGGFTDIEDIDVDRYIAKSRSLQDTQLLGKLGEYFATHPMIHKRLKALELFANSEAYYRAINRTPPKGTVLLNTEQLNAKTNELLRVV